ncbi:uncharacterized protein LOC119669700 [Teleopsis dalmanni]|uniref:uncharacterized protein LOC119669700 n=1 Tax=Teleopsis dalmanni TaxID=139649 RepID=UPI000D32C126|nr:uncharacterized protein LOC119669700 [Teleopsis dalmanni]
MASNISNKEWAEDIKSRLESIYQQLSDFEEIECMQDDRVNILEMLEILQEMQNDAKSIQTTAFQLNQKRNDIQNHIDLLQKSVDLLNLESPDTDSENFDNMNQNA